MNAIEKTILLVEDESIICRNQADILKQEGYKVITALSAKAAIDKFNKGNKIDLIIMDIDLGKGMDGTQVAEIILRDHNIPLIFLSGHTETEMISKTEKIVFYGFVVKGSGDNVLSAAIKMAFRLHSSCMENIRHTESIKDSELRYRRLFESAKDGILILDADQGKIIDVNPYLMELLGHSYDEMTGKFLWEISPFKDITANREKFLELQKQGYVHYEHLPLMNKNGTVKDVEFVSNVYWVDDKKIIQCNIRDIEKRKKYENVREAMLTAKGTMLRELQHRIKNSMAVIISLINLELKRSSDPGIQGPFFRIRDRINAISNLYAILNSFKNMDKVQLDQYIEKMLNELFRCYVTAKKQIHLDMHLDKILIDTDTAMPVGLVLNELVTNSLKHAFPGGRNGSVQIVLKHQKKDVIIEILDDGVGFPPGFHIEESEGFGMSLILMLIEQIKGNLEQPVIDKGTLFRIRFPLTKVVD